MTTTAANTSFARPAARMPAPPPVRPDPPQTTARSDAPNSARASSPLTAPLTNVAHNVAALAADPAAHPLGSGLAPQPSGRLPLQAALLAALTTPFELLAPPAVTPAARPVPVPPSPQGIAETTDTFQNPSMAPASLGGTVNLPRRRMFDSPTQFLTSHLMPAAASPFGAPQGMPIEIWAQHPWPFAESLAERLTASLSDNSVSIAALVVAPLVVMTALTAAGAGVSGRPLRHTAWRAARRYGPLAGWGTSEPAAADTPPRRLTVEPTVTPWPDQPPSQPTAKPVEVEHERQVA